MLTLKWRARALDDLAEIVDFIAVRNPVAAARLQATIENCAERLPDHPFLYRPGRVAGTREAIVHPNYILVYHVVGDAIEIVNVIHARQRYP